MLAISGALISQIPKITIDSSMEGFMHKDDPALLAYNDFRDQFGRDEIIAIVLNSDNLFDLPFLEKLKSLHEELAENIPHLDDITSLINVRNTYGMEETLVVENLMERWPENEGDLAKLKKDVLSNPFYKNLIISENGKTTTVAIKTYAFSYTDEKKDVLEEFALLDNTLPGPNHNTKNKPEFLSSEENSRIVNRVREIAAKYRSKDFPIYITGSPVMTNDIKQSMRRDLPVFMIMAVVTIAILLFILFRKISGVLIPLFIVLISLLSIIGLMAIFKVPIKLPTQILPSFLLAVGVGDSVHILSIFFKRLQETHDRKEAITYAMGHSGLAIVFTSITTAAGLLSFSAAEVAPIADLGKFTGAGVMIALIYTIILLPALIALNPVKTMGNYKEKEKFTAMDRLLGSIGSFSVKNAKAISVAGITILLISLISSSLLHFSHNPLLWLPETMEIRKATEYTDREMKGSISVEVIIDTGEENGLYEPEILNLLDELSKDLKTYKKDNLFVGKTISLSDMLKEIHKALNENHEKYYTIPQDRKLIAQEFLLFENSGSDDLEDIVDSQFSKTRFTIKVPQMDSVVYAKFIDYVAKVFNEKFSGKAKITVTGMTGILSKTLYAAIKSAAKSYIIAGLVITLLMVFLIGDIKLGIISMIPNITPIVVTLGLMYWFEIPLDMFTMLIGSIAIGLAVDDTIHFMHNFRRYFEISGNVSEAVIRTLQTTGRAMLITTIVLATGFFIFTLSSMNNLFYFGLLTGTTVILALAADFLLAPALITIMLSPKTK